MKKFSLIDWLLVGSLVVAAVVLVVLAGGRLLTTEEKPPEEAQYLYDMIYEHQPTVTLFKGDFTHSATGESFNDVWVIHDPEDPETAFVFNDEGMWSLPPEGYNSRFMPYEELESWAR